MGNIIQYQTQVKNGFSIVLLSKMALLFFFLIFSEISILLTRLSTNNNRAFCARKVWGHAPIKFCKIEASLVHFLSS